MGCESEREMRLYAKFEGIWIILMRLGIFVFGDGGGMECMADAKVLILISVEARF